MFDVSVYESFIGRAVFIRTATYHCTGVVVKVHADYVELEKAAWIPSSGKYSDVLHGRVPFEEVQMYKHNQFVHRLGIIDFTEIDMEHLPTTNR